VLWQVPTAMSDREVTEWVVIALMGVVTLFTRIVGVALVRWIPQTFFWQRFMQHLPSTLLVAIVVPGFISGDTVLTMAAALTLLTAALGLHFVASMGLGIASVALLRLIV
jgi:uncharacterized membrane protein